MRLVAALVAFVSLAVAVGYSSAGSADVETVTITIEHSRFTPSRLEVAADSTVEFVIVNNDPIDHEFIVGDDEVQQAHELGTEREHDERPTEISVPGGETVRTTVDFPSAGVLSAADPLLFGCHLPGHYAYGMRGVIQVVE